MKCRAWVFLRKNGKRFETLPGSWGVDELKHWRETLPKHYLEKIQDFPIVCDGNVKVSITAENLPYYGGTDAALWVEFKCDKCGHKVYPDLPNEYNINEWVNGLLDKME